MDDERCERMTILTDHERAFQIFQKQLLESDYLKEVRFKTYAGLPFLYVQPKPACTRDVIENEIKRAAAKGMKGKSLTLTMSFVRKNQAEYVYRVRFLVPQRKMFCCGNLCDDCIRFTNP